jgi:hypothetical protein
MQTLSTASPSDPLSPAADLQILVLSAGRPLIKCDMELPLSAEAQARVASDAAAGDASAVADFTEVRVVTQCFARASSYSPLLRATRTGFPTT